MSSHYFVDAHTLLWHLTNDSRLGKAAAEVLRDAESRLFLPATALAEALFILERKTGLYPLTESVFRN
ncbi:MAG: PIN domain-containing protein [Caldilineaceae bacterium]